MDRNELVAKMRARVAMCRRLAKGSTDQRTIVSLLSMAEEGEADIARLLAEKDSA